MAGQSGPKLHIAGMPGSTHIASYIKGHAHCKAACSRPGAQHQRLVLTLGARHCVPSPRVSLLCQVASAFPSLAASPAAATAAASCRWHAALLLFRQAEVRPSSLEFCAPSNAVREWERRQLMGACGRTSRVDRWRQRVPRQHGSCGSSVGPLAHGHSRQRASSYSLARRNTKSNDEAPTEQQ